jgi:aryl-alcohol dehydrogenase-like predicted oxidoreductase
MSSTDTSASSTSAGCAPPNAALAGRIALGGDVSVNRLGFGAMRITGPGIWGEPRDPEEARRALRRAVALGVTFIDTAHSYGPEVSERLIAEALYPYPDDLVIATKSGLQRSGPDAWHPDGRPEAIRHDCERSLSLLRTERIDLFQLHRVDPDVPIEESLGTFVDLRDEGKVDMIGVSNVDTVQLQRARAVTEIVSVQNRYSVDDRTSEGVLATCEQIGIAFLPWSPLGAGPLTRERELQAVARAQRATAAQVAIAWLLQRSPVMLPIPGTSSVAHLEDNLGAAGLRLSEEDFSRLAH